MTVSPTSSSPAEQPSQPSEPSRPSESPRLARARRLLAAADSAGAPLRLLGGAGIQLMLGQRLHPLFARELADVDFITTRKAGGEVERLLQGEGLTPDRQFNALNGARRLLFFDEEGGGQVDVFVERFEMCHSLPFAERLRVRAQTLPAAELTMSKLQIVQLNQKDRNDLYALLTALEVADADFDASSSTASSSAASPAAAASPAPASPAAASPAAASPAADAPHDTINAARIAQLAGEDWGLHHTFELNLARLDAEAQRARLPDQLVRLVRTRTAALLDAIECAPKSRAWKLRAKIGERRRWYEEPEEVER
ncbi:MAG: hypothetical protein ACYCU0_14200 [Solirubrobacteraceae bacterium]